MKYVKKELNQTQIDAYIDAVDNENIRKLIGTLFWRIEQLETELELIRFKAERAYQKTKY